MVKTKRRLNIFVCGPTVYDYQHIGNGKTQLAFDLFVRYLRSEGYEVFYLQNVTDIDDKIIKRANDKNIPWAKLADRFFKIYREDIKSLGITSIDKYARATKFIKQIVAQVKTLQEKGYAYKIEGDGYYFNIAKFGEYGKLSHRTTEQAEDGVSRIDDSSQKINKGDFCLWKFHNESAGGQAEPYWDTSLGQGRPGWHIEDTAITEKFFGPQYDIHGGGLDLKFPHHEAELAQQEAASGKKPFVRFWMHSGLVYINGEKMSKSLGNFLTIRDFLKKCEAQVFRYMVLMHHYRSPMNYTADLQHQAEQSLQGLREFVAKLIFTAEKNSRKKIESNESLKKFVGEADSKWRKALADDFNTPSSLAAIFDLVAFVQPKMWTLNAQDARMIANFIIDKMGVWGIAMKPGKIDNKVQGLISEREQSRVNQQFTKSDALRKEIEGLGYKVEDTPLGQFVLKSS